MSELQQGRQPAKIKENIRPNLFYGESDVFPGCPRGRDRVAFHRPWLKGETTPAEQIHVNNPVLIFCYEPALWSVQ